MRRFCEIGRIIRLAVGLHSIAPMNGVSSMFAVVSAASERSVSSRVRCFSHEPEGEPCHPFLLRKFAVYSVIEVASSLHFIKVNSSIYDCRRVAGFAVADHFVDC